MPVPPSPKEVSPLLNCVNDTIIPQEIGNGKKFAKDLSFWPQSTCFPPKTPEDIPSPGVSLFPLLALAAEQQDGFYLQVAVNQQRRQQQNQHQQRPRGGQID